MRSKRETKRFRKLTGMFFTVAALGLLTACQSGKLADCFTKEEVEQQAVEDIELASSDNYEGWVERFQDDLQSSLTPETYETFLAELEKKGEFQEYGKTAVVGQEQDGKNYAGAIVVVNYEEGDLTYTISYNENMEMVGFLIK